MAKSDLALDNPDRAPGSAIAGDRGVEVAELSKSEHDLLRWLAQEDLSQYGECHGKTLDALIAKGFAQVLQGREHQGAFIAKGDSLMYRAVCVTDDGRAALAKARAA